MNDKRYQPAQGKSEEASLRAAWQELSDEFANVPTPNILPRLRERLQSTRPATTARPYKFAYASSFAVAGVAVCALGLLAWGHKRPQNAHNATLAPQKTVALLPAPKSTGNEVSLAEMLQEVRWRSSEERKPHREPPAYNETTRALLLPEKGKRK